MASLRITGKNEGDQSRRRILEKTVREDLES